METREMAATDGSSVASPPSKETPLSPPSKAAASPPSKPWPAPRRPRRGQRNESAFPITVDVDGGLAALLAIESPFQVQEYIAALVRHDPHDIARIVTLPGKQSGKGKEVEGVNGNEEAAEVDPNVWLYEQMRRVAQDLTSPWMLALQECCSRQSCPEMKAGEWLYLCAAHSAANEHECCAIDYSMHTLDGATTLLNNGRYFPSRLSIPPTSFKHFTSIARRLYRIFAHAYFHHRDIFEACEAESSLYARFLLLSSNYSLISSDLLVVPADEPTKGEDTVDEHRRDT